MTIQNLPAARRTGLSLTALAALIHLHQQGDHTCGQLAASLGITPAAATGIADTLENGGWIRRLRSTTDRRVTHLSLTTKANKTLTTIATPVS